MRGVCFLRRGSGVALGLAVAVAVVFGATGAPTAALAQPRAFGDGVKIVRALDEWRLAEARVLLDELAARAPDSDEVRFLRAQLHYLQGDYKDALGLLDGMSGDRVDGARRELRALVASTMAAVEGHVTKVSPGGHFIILYPPGRDEVLVDLAAEALERARAQIGEDLGWVPDQPIRVEFLSRPADLARVSTLSLEAIETTGTIALCKYNKLMVVSPRATLFGYPWLDTLAHELTHYIVYRGGANRVPIWLHEGLAKFEESRWRAAPGADGVGRVGAHFLAQALKRGRLVTFEEMHPSMALLPSQEAAATAFAEVYTMVAWLHGRVGYDGLRRALGLIRDGKSERRAIAEVLGTSWESVEAEWRRHLRTLDLKPDPELSGHRGRPIRFAKGEKDENSGLADVPEERARRFARLGGLLRARGRLPAAAIEYEKALAAAPDDPFIGHKLARTYLETGAHRRAAEIAEPLTRRDPEDAGPRAVAGAAYLLLGETARAVEHLEAAVRVQPFDPAVRCGLAEAYTVAGDAARATREQAACDRLR